MSTSGSTTPTNTFSTDIKPSFDSTTSRTPPHLPSQLTLAEGDKPQSLHFTQIYSLPPSSRSTPSSSIGHRMTRQLQGEQTFSRPVAESSISSDSQKDAAGTSKEDGPSEPAPPPPKKKRTRTLTTPHQTAVLHALLAKNQRQKARRPHSQSDTSRKKPPQTGAFPSHSGTSPLGSFPLAPDPSSSYSASMSRSTEMGRSVARGHYSLDQFSDRGGSSSQLSGPGMPGLESSSDLTYRRHHVISSRPSTAYEGFIRYRDLRDRTVRSPSPVRLYLPPPAPHTTITSGPYERDPSRTLPPLVFPSASLRTSFSAPGPSGPSHAAFDSSYTERRSSSPVFAYQPPESTARGTWPPYEFRPRLGWPTLFDSTLRSSQTPSWALQEQRLASRSVTPTVPGAERPPVTGEAMTEEDVQPTEARPPQRSGRYDPIRGTFIYSSPPEDH
ncbi:hypothetical protein C0995_008282 [Termitomyces sp. Mi166|nr:hypothetical protein C0995_008282 [Termitomyces sp. Mi166\